MGLRGTEIIQQRQAMTEGPTVQHVVSPLHTWECSRVTSEVVKEVRPGGSGACLATHGQEWPRRWLLQGWRRAGGTEELSPPAEGRSPFDFPDTEELHADWAEEGSGPKRKVAACRWRQWDCSTW